MTRHLRCFRWALAAAAVGLAWTAWAQQNAAPPDALGSLAADPTTGIVVSLLQGGGLPAVLAVAAWWARGSLASGVPIVVALSAEDRELLRKVVRHLARAVAEEHPKDDSLDKSGGL